ncbi:hypothetical protein AX17_003458 [Amanita inopinata Kibby_2008]|nr:hypothetical protein AX17_003458 [Amanita inopinata Kibby_2008]
MRGACNRHMSAATATKLKPRTWDVSEGSAVTQRATPSKWARPSTSKFRPPFRVTSDDSECVQLPGSMTSAKHTVHPARRHQPTDPFPTKPTPTLGSLHDHASSSRPSGFVSSSDALPTPRGKPRHLSKAPTADALNKWMRQTTYGTEECMTQSTSFHASKKQTASPSVDQEEGPRYNVLSPPSTALSTNVARDERNHKRRTGRDPFKQRESLLSGLQQENDSSTRWSMYSESQQRQIKRRMKKYHSVTPERLDVFIPTTVSVGNLARLLNVRLGRLQRQMRLAGMVDEATYDYVLTADYAALLAQEFGRNPVISDEAAFDIHPQPPHQNSASLPPRPPVVTIMGHVDHGKTTLLDSLRSSAVAKGEAGGITQHIGAFSVTVSGASDAESSRAITFLDTPGHAAFSAMRARGARITDIIVLVVAADDGIMPQTLEVIDLIKKEDGKVGVVVAINKVDKPGVNIDRIQKALLAESLQLETFGGDIPCVEVSGLTGCGLPELIETISAMAEMQDLHAERDGLMHGYILESRVQKGLGPVATVLVLRGCLQAGSHLISGINQAKIRLIKDSAGATVKVAYPGMAVTVSGWKTLPSAGDEVLQGTEGDVKKAIANRERRAEIEASLADVDAINASRRQEKLRRNPETMMVETPQEEDSEGPKELKLLIKADVSGSAEAVVGALQGIGNQRAGVKIIFSGVGDISEADVTMAKAVGGTIVGFSVTAPRAVETLAARNGVSICTSNVIYRLMDDIKQKVIGLLPATVETTVTGEATVLQLFDIQLKAKQLKKVAGCRVTNGIVEKSSLARVVREGTMVHEGTFDTMRHLKKDVTEVRKGSECGLSFCDFSDLRQGDLIQIYKRIEKPGIL